MPKAQPNIQPKAHIFYYFQCGTQGFSPLIITSSSEYITHQFLIHFMLFFQQSMYIAINHLFLHLHSSINHTLTNMAHFVSISILVVALVLCIFMHATTMVNAAVSMAASKSPALELEAKALMETRWWTGTSNGTSLSHCKWYGITCNDGGSVTEINMARFYLGYEISKLNFSCFPNLVRLSLSLTELWGSIPHEIGTLSKLTYLDLSNNVLEGELPISLTDLTQLVTFNISYNSLISGSIPSSLDKLTNLVTLSLHSNQISSSIPFSLDNLTNLVTLSLHINQINGSISQEIGNMNNLCELHLNNNELIGEIPFEPRYPQHLEILDLSYNNFTRNIPVFSTSIKKINK